MFVTLALLLMRYPQSDLAFVHRSMHMLGRDYLTLEQVCTLSINSSTLGTFFNTFAFW